MDMIEGENILAMKVTYGAPKIITMAVSSSNILALMRWGQS